LNLIDPLLRGVREEGYTIPTPIQQQAIPHVLAGRDLLGCAQTGTGKTAAFALPILQRLAGERHNGNGNGNGKHPAHVRALILAPTRELATQIGESFRAYGRYTGLKHATIYGGVGQNPQVAALRKGVDILVATPGRLLDLIGQGYVKLDRIEVFVLDEADRMLDMGFIYDVRRVVQTLPRQRQTLMFSATLLPDIQKLAHDILIDPVSVAVTPAATTVELTEQRVYFVEKGDKPALLQHLLSDSSVTRVLVFTRTKHGANKVVKQLGMGRIQAEPIHSNKSQAAREKALANFKAGRTKVLVATDIAARGIDVDNISHVINFDLPNESETYVHRIGRTGRAGAAGIALSFCSGDERAFLAAIERLIRQRIPVVSDHPYVSEARPSAPKPQAGSRQGAQRQRPGGDFNRSRNNQRPNRPGGDPKGFRRHKPGGSRPQATPVGVSSAPHEQGHSAPHSVPQGSSRPAQSVRRPRLVR
jgi:ATP-dependent RNA helicase RhlE